MCVPVTEVVLMAVGGWQVVVVEHEAPVSRCWRDSLAVICVWQGISDAAVFGGVGDNLLMSRGIVVMVLVEIIDQTADTVPSTTACWRTGQAYTRL